MNNNDVVMFNVVQSANRKLTFRFLLGIRQYRCIDNGYTVDYERHSLLHLLTECV